MVDIRRHETIIIESDEVYLARTFDEARNELVEVWTNVKCEAFMLDDIKPRCELCSMYAIDNVKDLAKRDLQGEKCSIRLALNHLAAVRNIAKTGKP